MTAVKTKEARIRMLSWKTHSLVPPVEMDSEPGKLLSVLTRMCFVLLSLAHSHAYFIVPPSLEGP